MIDSWLRNWAAVAEALPPWGATVLGVLVLLVLAAVTAFLARHILVRGLQRVTRTTRFDWDNTLVDSGALTRLAQLLPALIVYYGLELTPGLSEAAVSLGQNLAMAYTVLMLALAISAVLSAANSAYARLPMAKERPIKGYIQVAKIVLFLVAGVLILAILIERNPVLLLSGLGAMTAVLMLVFKDTILSLVASVQLTSNDMARVGDWIEMPSSNADGDVIDIALHTVKVQNWDKTITTIPTYKLISMSFKNWRGMSQSGGRRIKRCVYIDLNSIRFLNEQELERFKQVALLKDYIATKEADLARENAALSGSASANLRRLTNVGTFRAYVRNYLENHPRIHREMTLLVRQLQPGPQGLPLEIYAFTNTTDWSDYEAIQADIFDHLLAIVGEFGLNLYQQPSGEDLTKLGHLATKQISSPASTP